MYKGEDGINLTILDDHKSISIKAARIIASAINEANEKEESFVLGLATGVTTEVLYEELIRINKEEGISFQNVKCFNLDNYYGLKDDNRNSYVKQLKELFIDHTDIKQENVNLVSGVNFDHNAYETDIKDAGGIDIQVLGVGSAGKEESVHIGFNEKGSTIDSRTRKVKLEPGTMANNAHFFDKPGEKVPTHANTMGIETILELTKKTITLASGMGKAWSVRLTMDPIGLRDQNVTSLEMFQQRSWEVENVGENHLPTVYPSVKMGETPDFKYEKAFAEEYISSGEPVQRVPSRALHAHPEKDDNVFLVDRQAASMLGPVTLYNHSNLKPEEISDFIEEFSLKQVEIEVKGEKKKIWITPKFDFYHPEKMGVYEKFDYKNVDHLKYLGDYLTDTTDLSCTAHQDDAEIENGIQILQAQRDPKKNFLNIIATDGASSKSRLNRADADAEGSKGKPFELQELPERRWREQRDASSASKTPSIQLGYPSNAVNGLMGDGKKAEVVHILSGLFDSMPNLKDVFLHNPLDKHDTHLGVLACSVAAFRSMDSKDLPDNIVGMEGWGGLAGMPHGELVKFVTENKQDLEEIKGWISLYTSQLDLQLRAYDKVTIALYEAHAGFVTDPHSLGVIEGMAIGVKLTDYIKNPDMQLEDMAEDLIRIMRDHKLTKASKHEVPKTELGKTPWKTSPVKNFQTQI